jgi:hypothetical protein
MPNTVFAPPRERSVSSLVVIALAPEPELVWLSVCTTVAALSR